jgi:hypothetical protein
LNFVNDRNAVTGHFWGDFSHFSPDFGIVWRFWPKLTIFRNGLILDFAIEEGYPPILGHIFGLWRGYCCRFGGHGANHQPASTVGAQVHVCFEIRGAAIDGCVDFGCRRAGIKAFAGGAFPPRLGKAWGALVTLLGLGGVGFRLSGGLSGSVGKPARYRDHRVAGWRAMPPVPGDEWPWLLPLIQFLCARAGAREK